MTAVAPSDLLDVAARILVAAGADADEARVTAEALVWADHRGRGPQGTVWLEAICARLREGGTVSPATITTVVDRPSLTVLDAGAAIGQVAGRLAVEIAADKARDTGVAAVAVRNSTHFGPCGYYASLLAERGLLGVAATNAYPKVAPHGGRQAALGTNPIGFAAPVAGGDPVIGDLSTGALAGSRVREALDRGEPLETGMALDKDGAPTTDPARLQDGGVMLPMAGAKGMALGILVELLTSGLSGGVGPSGLGSMFRPTEAAGTSHFVLALDVGDSLAGGAAEIVAAIDAADTDGQSAVRLPGAVGHELQRTGTVDLDQQASEAIRRCLEACGLERPQWLN